MPGACYIEMAFDAVLMDTKIEPLVIKDVVFQNTLQLNENSARNVKCVKNRPASDGLAEFTVYLTAEDGELVLSTAKLKKFRTTGREDVLTMADACKYLLKHENKTIENYLRMFKAI